MNQPSPEWIAEQHEAERAMVVRFDGLTDLAIRLERYATRAEESAAVLARLDGGNPDARRQEAEDLRRTVQMVAFFAGNLDRVHLLEQPSRRQGGAYGTRRAAR
jgi:hypothetical protein